MRTSFLLLGLLGAGLLPAGCALQDQWPFKDDRSAVLEPQAGGAAVEARPAEGAVTREVDAAYTEVANGKPPAPAQDLQAAAAPVDHQVAPSDASLSDEIESLVQSVMGPAPADASDPSGAPSATASNVARPASRVPAVPRFTPENITNATRPEPPKATVKKPAEPEAANPVDLTESDAKAAHEELFPKPRWRKEMDEKRASDPASHDLPRGF